MTLLAPAGGRWNVYDGTTKRKLDTIDSDSITQVFEIARRRWPAVEEIFISDAADNRSPFPD